MTGMEKQKHAPLSAIRDAIRGFRVIRFTYDGRRYTVEPRELGRSPVGSFLLKAFVREGSPNGGLHGWADFYYWKIRGLQILPERFHPGPERPDRNLLAA